MYCIIPLVLGFIAGRSCGYNNWGGNNCGCGCGGYNYNRRCCPPRDKCIVVNCPGRK